MSRRTPVTVDPKAAAALAAFAQPIYAQGEEVATLALPIGGRANQHGAGIELHDATGEALGVIRRVEVARAICAAVNKGVVRAAQ